MKTYVVSAHKKCLGEAFQMSAQNMLCGEIRKILSGYFLSRALGSTTTVFDLLSFRHLLERRFLLGVLF